MIELNVEKLWRLPLKNVYRCVQVLLILKSDNHLKELIHCKHIFLIREMMLVLQQWLHTNLPDSYRRRPEEYDMHNRKRPRIDYPPEFPQRPGQYLSLFVRAQDQ